MKPKIYIYLNEEPRAGKRNSYFIPASLDRVYINADTSSIALKLEAEALADLNARRA